MLDNAALTITLVGLIIVFFALAFVAGIYTYFVIQEKRELSNEVRRFKIATKELEDATLLTLGTNHQYQTVEYDIVKEEPPKQYPAPSYLEN